ncbi:MAG TPA: SIMPL domain-containing protein [Intrasporangium sp.]|uniref:SIMPL domain-containing protein n=1 Tax=Intrasporangium sp. TaxID=1925024 RepID=UPI002D774128|nr:SIMPL domain-containing protein [Intrasporangium sp.]HET7397770.1 SIMPL domain-containing protein [Intrasporangium sp.]
MDQRTVTVTGSGTAAVTPDVVRLDLRVGHDAADVGAALAGAASGVTAVVASVRASGVADADIRTLDADVSQRFDATGRPVGFTAQQRLRVVVRRPETVGALLERAAGEVGNALLVDQVRLDVADRRPALAEARDAAYADARAKAEQYAALAGGALGDVLGVVEDGALPVSAVPFGVARDSAVGMPVETGELELGAAVTVTWDLTAAGQ